MKLPAAALLTIGLFSTAFAVEDQSSCSATLALVPLPLTFSHTVAARPAPYCRTLTQAVCAASTASVALRRSSLLRDLAFAPDGSSAVCRHNEF